MSITAVPLQPIAKGSLRTLWVGLAAVALSAGGLAYYGTAEARAKYQDNAEWFADNAKEDGVVTTKSGLQYRIVTQGTGRAATVEDVVIAGYKGTLRDGTEFDAAPQVDFHIGETIPGFDEGLKLAKKGAKMELWIPSDLAYGEREIPNPQTGEVLIPANSMLHFEVDVIDVVSEAEFQKVMEAQQKQMQDMQGQVGGDPAAGAPPPQGQPQ
jgi:FKBP-type peptidyl-prolyl cis-trans isomerase FkpA